MGTSGELLHHLIRQVRRRWLLARGLTVAAVALAAFVVLVVGSVLIATHFQFQPIVVTVARAVALTALLLTGGALLWWYVRRAPEEQRIARFIEEKSGGLHDRLVTAIEVMSARAGSVPSPAIGERLLADAARAVSDIRPDAVVPRRALLVRSLAAALPPFVLALILGLNEWPLRSGAIKLYAPWLNSVMPSLSIVVRPGDVTVPRGLDQVITASLQGFESETATVFFKTPAQPSWRQEAMERTPDGHFRFLFFNLQETVEYYVSARSIRSPSFTIHVRDLPMVSRLTLIYNYPGYTRLPSKTVEDGGDIVALRGTVVTVIAHLTSSAQSARIRLGDGHVIPMAPSGTDRFSGQITIQKNSSYRIELMPTAGEPYPGSSEYSITALEDDPPLVVMEKPGRDLKVTNLQEVFTEVRAEDDSGIGKLELYYSVNGGPEQRVTLYNAAGDAPRTITGSHTIFLEEFQLQPGDVVSYYARAEDNNRATGPGVATTDIYFLEVRPFDRRFRQAQQAPGMQGGEQDAGAFSQRQKEIIAATWRVVREKDRWSPAEFNENMNAIELAQTKLRSDVQTLIERIRRRLGEALDQQTDFKTLVENLEAATEAMAPAVDQLRARKAREALPFEQRAYQHLLRADAVFREIQVAFGNAGEGGESRAQDLADLFELELDKMKNQYETVQRDRGEQRNRELDETIRRLRELAERQQRLAEQQMRQGMPSSSSGGGGSQSQQQLAEELRSLARQLERLSREQNDPRLSDIGRQLSQAAREMDQARASGSPTEAAARALRALEQLEAARRQLQGASRGQLEQEISRLRQQAAELQRKQREIVRDVDQLARRGQSAGESSAERRQALEERKGMLAQQVERLGQDIEQTARSVARESPATAEKLRAAGGVIRRERLPEQIEQSSRLLRNEWYDYARERERQIQRGLDQVAQSLEAAGRQFGQDRAAQSLEEALDRTKRLGDSLEALERRLREQRGESGQAPAQQQARSQSQTQGQEQMRDNASTAQNQSQGQAQGSTAGREQQGERGQRGQRAATQPSPSADRQGDRRTSDALTNPIGRMGPAEDSSADATSPVRPRSGSLGHDAEALRQLDRELRERLSDAEDIRRLLGRDPALAADLDRVISRLRQLDEEKVFHDPRQLDLLKSAVIDPLRRIEFELSRKLQEKLGHNTLRLGDDLSVPEAYRSLVEDYYKRLSRQPRR